MPPTAEPCAATSLRQHVEDLAACSRCPQMVGPVVAPPPVRSKVMLVGQAPGPREGAIGRPFAWTAGKTLFKWLAAAGLDEDSVRSKVYISAVCRCFPGKNPNGGDRVPSREEIAACAPWLDAEFALLKPALVLAVGKLAITQFMPVKKLDSCIGKLYAGERRDVQFDLLPLPHPSGASTWHRTEPGITLLAAAQQELAQHPAWQALRER